MGAETEVLPIFPLSNVVLFPRVTTPLHLFEPRYRQMAEHVLAGRRRIGMVTVRPEHVGAMRGDPPVHPVGCAGVVTRSRKRSDGRYDILLHGTHRFRIQSERVRSTGRLYRVAEVALLEDAYDPADADRVAELRTQLVEIVSELMRASNPDQPPPTPESWLRDLDDATFVNSLANTIALPPLEKQSLLESDGIYERCERLKDLLSFQLAGLRTLARPLSGAIH